MNAPSQWETTLHCNVVSHWLGAYTKWSLISGAFSGKLPSGEWHWIIVMIREPLVVQLVVSWAADLQGFEFEFIPVSGAVSPCHSFCQGRSCQPDLTLLSTFSIIVSKYTSHYLTSKVVCLSNTTWFSLGQPHYTAMLSIVRYLSLSQNILLRTWN